MTETETFFYVIIFLAIVIFGPIFTIGALNTLFNLNIQVTVATYFSIFWLQLVFSAHYAGSKK